MLFSKTKKFILIFSSIFLFVPVFWNSYALGFIEGDTGERVILEATNEDICNKCKSDENCITSSEVKEMGVKCCIKKSWSDQTRCVPKLPEPDTGLSELSAELNARKPILQINIPGLNFSNVLSTTDDTGTYFHIPWIPELISALYKFGIAIVSIVAVVVIIIQGMRVITSAGGEAKQSAYKKILQSVIGLGIAWGSFAILYNVNPNLVKFNALRVKVVEAEPLIQESDAIPENNYPTITNVQKPTWDAATFDCGKRASYEPAGVVSPADIISYFCAGLEGKISTIKEMKDPLCQVGKLARAEGYTIEIRSSYRDFNGQINNWCGSGLRNYPNPQERKAYNATPGFSNHGHGRAVDAILKKNGKALFEATSKKQCAVNPEYIAKIANLFYAADPNFVRLETEIWHFEYGTVGQGARSRTTGAGSKCK